MRRSLLFAFYICIQLSAFTHLCLATQDASHDTLQNWSVNKKKATLQTGDSLVSLNGEYKAIMQKHGQLQVFDKDERLVSKIGKYFCKVQGSGHHITMQPNGNLVIYNDKTGKPTWKAGTDEVESGGNEHYLRLENNGLLVVYGADNEIIWDSENGLHPVTQEGEEEEQQNGDNNTDDGDTNGDNHDDGPKEGPCPSRAPMSGRQDLLQNWASVGQILRVGDSLMSSNGLYKAIMEANAQLITFDKYGEVIAKVGRDVGSSRESGYYMVMQEDGNLVIYGEDTNRHTWTTATDKSDCSGASHYLRLLNDGTLVMYDLEDKIIWKSRVVMQNPPNEDNDSDTNEDAPDCSALPAMSNRLDLLQNQASVGDKSILRVGDSLVSINKLYKAVMQASGQLLIFDEDDKIVGRVGNDLGYLYESGYYMIMQVDGKLVIYSEDTDKAVWGSGTDNWGGCWAQRQYLRLMDDGVLVMYSSEGLVIWSSESKEGQCPRREEMISRGDTLQSWSVVGDKAILHVGESLVSQNGLYKATLQKNGQLYIFDKDNEVISKMGDDRGYLPVSGYRMIMQPDGNLVIYDNTNSPTWVSYTGYYGECEKIGQFARLLNDGRLVIYGPQDNIVWTLTDCPVIEVMNDRSDILQSWAIAGEKAVLHIGDSLVSQNGEYKAVMQKNGELQIFNKVNQIVGRVGKAFNHIQKSGYRMILKSDGVIAIYDDTNTLTWQAGASDTGCSGVAQSVQLLNDGKVVLYGSDHYILWDSINGDLY